METTSISITKLADLIFENWSYKKDDEASRRKKVSSWINNWLEGQRYSSGNVNLTNEGILVYKGSIGKTTPIGCFIPVKSENVVVQNFGEQ